MGGGRWRAGARTTLDRASISSPVTGTERCVAYASPTAWSRLSSRSAPHLMGPPLVVESRIYVLRSPTDGDQSMLVAVET
jgi:hypothetical protein